MIGNDTDDTDTKLAHHCLMEKRKPGKIFIDYLHSSAKFYKTGVQGIFNVTHYIDVWN
ncbi:MAG: hypothetical protein LH473_04260 [Chitinophagales bacterium]|nr:hypothetical protein [Chitinophagales bacterium]